MTSRAAAERRGRRAEWFAAFALMAKGYRIISRRVRMAGGEIDLVAIKGKIIAYVEVKAYRAPDAAMQAVTPKAQQRIARAAAQWVAKRPRLVGYGQRFDIVIVRPWRWPRHLHDQWRPDFALTQT